MNLFDLIKEFRKGTPDVTKTARMLKIIGWGCFAVIVWNVVIITFFWPENNPFNIPDNFLEIVVVSLSLLGALFLVSSKAVLNRSPWGKSLAQLAVVLMVAGFIWGMAVLFPIDAFPSGEMSYIFIPFMILVSAQFMVPAFFAVLYLGRLPVLEETQDQGRFVPETIVKSLDDDKTLSETGKKEIYKDALLPFGLFGTLIILMIVPFFIVMAVMDRFINIPVFPLILFIFACPVVYNLMPSPFQKKRQVAASFTGGGSIFLFNGSWPFFRLLVYEDGLEIRVSFHRFFIPYDKMEDIPDKLGFFNRGLLIKSNLPGVPSGIRFNGFGMKNLIQTVNQFKKAAEKALS